MRDVACNDKNRVDGMLKWFGLRSRLSLLVLIALLPIVGLYAYLAGKTESSQSMAVALAKKSLQSDVLLAAEQQQRLLEGANLLLGRIASETLTHTANQEDCVRHFKRLHSQHASYVNFAFVGLDGRVSCHALDTAGRLYVGDRSFVQAALAGRSFAVDEYRVGRITGRPVLGIGMPVYGDGGVLKGVATTGLDIATLGEALSGIRMLEGAQLRMLDRAGNVLAVQPPSPQMLGKPEGDAIILKASLAAQAGVYEASDATGVQRLYAYAPVGGKLHDGLFVAISAPRDVVVSGGAAGLPRALWLYLLGAVVFVAFCTWWLGTRLIAGPANAILKQANEVVGGNLQARISGPFMQRGDIGKIAHAFNRMAESLQARREELDTALRHADEERNLLDMILNSMSEGVVAINTEGRFLVFNAAAAQLFGAPATGATLDDWRRDHELLRLDGNIVYPAEERPLALALRGVIVDDWDVRLRRPGDSERILRINIRPLRCADSQPMGGVAVIRDITAIKASEDFKLAQEQVLALIAAGGRLTWALEAIVLLMEKSLPGTLCSILLVDGGKLRHGASPSLPQSYAEAVEGMLVGEGRGCCGTAAYRREAVAVEDIGLEPLMADCPDLLIVHGLRACRATPVLSAAGEVLATFAVYSEVPLPPHAGDRNLMATVTRLARIALERARAEAALVSSEARFREMAENIDDMFYNFDVRSGRLLYVSPGYEKIWGHSRESLYVAPHTLFESVISEDRSALQLRIDRNQAGESSDTQYRITTADGRVRWVRDHTYPVFNAAGQVERLVGTARDITESKLANIALANTNRALQMLSLCSMAMNRFEDEIALLEEVCRIAVEVGGYRMAWIGYLQDDEGQSIKPIAHAGHVDGYLDEIELSMRPDHFTGQGPAGQALRSGMPQQSRDIGQAENFFYWSKEALQRGYRSALFLPLLDEQRSFGVLGLYSTDVQYFVDEEIRLFQEFAGNLSFGITSLRVRLERRRDQALARQAAAKLKEQASLLDRAQDAIMVHNLDLTIRFWNKSAERLYGWTAEDVLGKTMVEFMYREPQILQGAMSQTLGRQGDWTGELEQVARDGSTVLIEARWTVVRDEQGQINGVLCINTDIGERKRAREEILQLNSTLEARVQQRTAQLEFANKQLEAFAYSVSHDLRSPLGAVDGFSDLLLRSLEKASDDSQAERRRHYLGRIRAGVSQMGELIDAMLSLAQVSRSSLLWESVDLSSIANALLQGYRERDPARKTLLQVEPGLQAQGDPRLLKQVLDNLLGNAWKFSGKRPRTEIEFGHQTGAHGETIYFVRDNGAGFDMAYAEKLFGAFQRLHSLTEFAGTGIGLASVHRIIARHGGRVWAHSETGQGATFYFTLGQETL